VFNAGSRDTGDAAEARALDHLQRQGLTLVERNYRVARGPRARGGEIDLILRAGDGTLVFCEVRARRGGAYGGAAASVGAAKQRSLVFAAQHYLRASPPRRPAASTSWRWTATIWSGCGVPSTPRAG
jgi:putative endonuclease